MMAYYLLIKVKSKRTGEKPFWIGGKEILYYPEF